MDKTGICNLALSRLGVANINRLDEASEAARACTQFFEVTRKTVLQRYPWPFATRREELALLTAEPIDYEFAYRYPSDALRIWTVYAKDDRQATSKYKILSDREGRVICSDIELAAIEYTYDLKEPELWDVAFVEAFSHKLAAEIAMKLTSSLQLMSNEIQAYNAYFSEAAANNTNEEDPKEEYINPLLEARFNG